MNATSSHLSPSSEASGGETVALERDTLPPRRTGGAGTGEGGRHMRNIVQWSWKAALACENGQRVEAGL